MTEKKAAALDVARLLAQFIPDVRQEVVSMAMDALRAYDYLSGGPLEPRQEALPLEPAEGAWLTIKQAAKRARVQPQTIYLRIKRGDLRSEMVEGRRMVAAVDVAKVWGA